MAGQVHRFRDVAGLSNGTGETTYLTPKEARKAARALYAVARSIERERFGESGGLTVAFDTIRHGQPLPDHKRRDRHSTGVDLSA